MSPAPARHTLLATSMLTALALFLFYFLTAPAFWVIIYKRTHAGAAPPSSRDVRLGELATAYDGPYFWLMHKDPLGLLEQYQWWWWNHEMAGTAGFLPGP